MPRGVSSRPAGAQGRGERLRYKQGAPASPRQPAPIPARVAIARVMRVMPRHLPESWALAMVMASSPVVGVLADIADDELRAVLIKCSGASRKSSRQRVER